MTPLSGQLAVVTGASRGIGAATATALHEVGASVVRVSRTLSEGGPSGFHDLRCDLTDVRQIVQVSTQVMEEWGTPDLVVNNAGTFLLKPFEAIDPAELDAQLALNLRAPFLVAQCFLPAMRAVGRGLLINVGSVSDHQSFPENTAYAASKFGLRGWHQALAAEYRGTGVRLTLVSPGATDTDVWDPINPDGRGDLPSRAEMLRPSDVADAIVFAATRPPHATVEWLRLRPA